MAEEIDYKALYEAEKAARLNAEAEAAEAARAREAEKAARLNAKEDREAEKAARLKAEADREAEKADADRDAEIAARLKADADRDAEIAARLKAEDADREAAEAARSLGSLRKVYTPLLDRTDSNPHFPENHGNPTIVQQERQNFDSFIDHWIKDEAFWKTPLWAVPKSDDYISCDSETSAQYHIIQILDAILRALKLDRVVGVVTNRTLAGIECDILLEYKPNRLPFSPIEVKKPGNSPENMRMVFHGWPKKRQTKKRRHNDSMQTDENMVNGVAGQILNECVAVELFGYTKVVGLIATGNHFRLVGTGSLLLGDHAAIVQKIESLRQMSSNEKMAQSVSPQQGEVVYETNETNIEDNRKTLYASEIVPNLEDEVKEAGEDIVKLIVAYVLMACLSLTDLLDNKRPFSAITIRENMPCRILRKDQPHVFAFGTVSIAQLGPNASIRPDVATLHVIRHLESGANGSCCLAITESGSSFCAIKFFQRTKGMTTGDQARRELANWNAVYPDLKEKCFVWGNNETACLVMPYLRPIDSEERCKLLDNGVVERTLRKFAVSMHIHRDIKWRHFGIFQGSYYLSDLGDVQHSDHEGIDDWVAKSLGYLREHV